MTKDNRINAQPVPPQQHHSANVPQGTMPPQVNLGSAPPITNAAISAANTAQNTNFTQNPGYKRLSRGFPVEDGQNWHHLTQDQRQQWMRNHESRWKGKFGIAAGDAQPMESWTRG